MQSAAVSIITPTFNHERFIGECIESVLKQSFSDWEMIIIDDGSTDDTREIIAGYADKRIRYVYQDHVGPLMLGVTYNRALSMAQGEFVAILEGDDFWPSDKLACQVNSMQNSPTVLSYGLYKKVYMTDKGRKRYAKYLCGPETSPLSLANNDPVGYFLIGLSMGRLYEAAFPATLLIRRDALIGIGGFIQPEGLPWVDDSTVAELSLHGTFLFLPRLLGYWRRHGGAITHNEIMLQADGAQDHQFFLNFVNNNKEHLEMANIDVDGLVRGFEGSYLNAAHGGPRQQYAQELLHFGRMREAGMLFRQVIKDSAKGGKVAGTIRAAAYLGLMSSYCGIDVLEIVIAGYRKIRGFRRFIWALFRVKT